jgi:hypothetical protein
MENNKLGKGIAIAGTAFAIALAICVTGKIEIAGAFVFIIFVALFF